MTLNDKDFKIMDSSTTKLEKTVDISKILDEVRKENPYPPDVFTSRKGKFYASIWNDCLDKIEKKMRETENDDAE